jgi:Ras family protein A
LDSPESLKNVTAKWWLEVKEYCPKAAVVLVGTKADIWDQSASDGITQAKIEEVASTIHAFKSITCSAKKNENIGNVFDLAIQAVVQKRGGKCPVQ